MGYSRSTSTDWAAYASTSSTKTRAEIFTSTELDTEMSLLDVGVREARDSDANPKSTAIMVGVDVTGSMGKLAELIAKGGLSTLFTEVYDRQPVTDPAVMVLAIGDATQWDRAPLQGGQFESDVDTSKSWLEKIYIEGAGGGNSFESYDLPVYFAAYHTSIDCFEKRGEKGFIFTVGDELPPRMTEVECIKKTIDSDGDGLQTDLTFEEVIEAVQKQYHYFHIIIGEGSYARGRPDEVKDKWGKLLGQNAIWLDDYNALSETIISILQVTKGEDVEEVAASWSGDKSIAVRSAIKDLTAETDFDRANEVVRFDD